MTFPFISAGPSFPPYPSSSCLPVKDMTQEMAAIIREENHKARNVLIDETTQLPTELIELVISYLDSSPQVPRRPGQRPDKPSVILELPVAARVSLAVRGPFIQLGSLFASRKSEY